MSDQAIAFYSVLVFVLKFLPVYVSLSDCLKLIVVMWLSMQCVSQYHLFLSVCLSVSWRVCPCSSSWITVIVESFEYINYAIGGLTFNFMHFLHTLKPPIYIPNSQVIQHLTQSLLTIWTSKPMKLHPNKPLRGLIIMAVAIFWLYWSSLKEELHIKV